MDYISCINRVLHQLHFHFMRARFLQMCVLLQVKFCNAFIIVIILLQIVIKFCNVNHCKVFNYGIAVRVDCQSRRWVAVKYEGKDICSSRAVHVHNDVTLE